MSNDAARFGSLAPTAVLGQVALFWVAYLGVVAPAAFAKRLMPTPESGQFAWGLISVLLLLACTRYASRRTAPLPTDGEPAPGAQDAARFAVGLGLGFATYGITMLAISLVAAPITLTASPLPPLGATGLAVATVLLLALMEELGFRGYPLRALLAAVGPWRAQALVAVAFALLHVLYGYEWSAILMGVLPSGLLFGAGERWPRHAHGSARGGEPRAYGHRGDVHRRDLGRDVR